MVHDKVRLTKPLPPFRGSGLKDFDILSMLGDQVGARTPQQLRASLVLLLGLEIQGLSLLRHYVDHKAPHPFAAARQSVC